MLLLSLEGVKKEKGFPLRKEIVADRRKVSDESIDSGKKRIDERVIAQNEDVGPSRRLGESRFDSPLLLPKEEDGV